MARVTAERARMTKAGLLAATNDVLREQGYAGLTTRAVAAAAGAPMSQIQYHFGSKEGMVLALYEQMNSQLLARQNAMFTDPDLTLSEQWDLACDYLDDDLASGYVRVLQELLAAGWSNPEIGRLVRDGIMEWIALPVRFAGKVQEIHGPLGPFSPEEIGALVSASFIGAEALLLLGIEDQGAPIRQSLRRFGKVIRALENQQ